jgi:hypothetical protein
MDLLSTLLHEMGSAMGFAEDQGRDVAGMTLQAGGGCCRGAQPSAETQVGLKQVQSVRSSDRRPRNQALFLPEWVRYAPTTNITGDVVTAGREPRRRVKRY